MCEPLGEAQRSAAWKHELLENVEKRFSEAQDEICAKEKDITIMENELDEMMLCLQ